MVNPQKSQPSLWHSSGCYPVWDVEFLRWQVSPRASPIESGTRCNMLLGQVTRSDRVT